MPGAAGRLRALLLAAVCLGAAPAWAAGSPAEREAAFAAAVEAFDRGDYPAAYEGWLPLARNDDPAAQRNLGHLFRRGLGVRQDFERAAYWYQRAAELGLAAAQVNLGLMYLRGQGVPRHDAQAAYWLDAAARQGHVLAQYNLGLLYIRGRGVPESPPHALGWLYQAARAGHPGALEKLSQLVVAMPGHAVRPGAEEDDEAAADGPDAAGAGATAPLAMQPAAADPEDDDAPSAAGPEAVPESPMQAVIEAGRSAFRSGDYESAQAAWQVPARLGDREAQHLMGTLHAELRFNGHDLAESYRWHYLAALAGHAGSEAALEQLETRISAVDRVKGLQLVKAQQQKRQ